MTTNQNRNAEVQRIDTDLAARIFAAGLTPRRSSASATLRTSRFLSVSARAARGETLQDGIF